MTICIFPYQLDHLGIGQVGFGYDQQDGVDMHRFKYPQVIRRHLHPPVVCCDNQHCRVKSPRACHHVTDKPFVSGNIDDADRSVYGIFQGSKTQLNGHTPLLFFGDVAGFHSG